MLPKGSKKPKGSSKRLQNNSQEASKLFPRSPREASHEIPTNVHESSEPPLRLGGECAEGN